MKRLLKGLLVVTLALAAWWSYLTLFPGEEAVIRALLAEVAEKASSRPGEGNFAKAAAVNALVDCFSRDVEIRLEDAPGEISSIHGTGELQQVVLAARSQVRSARVTFGDILLEFGAAPGNATAQMLATARIDQQEELWVQELRMTLVKIAGAWKITRVETVKNLRL